MSTRNTRSVSSRLARKLAAYAAAGSALAATKASASIVYTNLGPDSVTVVNGVFDFDINQDGASDIQLGHDSDSGTGFVFCTTTSSGGSSCSSSRFRSQSAWVQGVNANAVVADDGGLALNLTLGALITHAARPQARLARFSATNFYSFKSGNFGGTTSGELHPNRGLVGLLFDIPGSGRHAAWADVEAAGNWYSVESVQLYRFAYETEPGKPILAGDTGVSPNVPGDTNTDGQVDIIDLNNVRNNFGVMGDGVLGDTDGDDVVDIEDLNSVRNNFGAANPVPEPPSLLLLAAGAAGLAVLRRRRAKREQDDVAACE